MTPLIVTCTIGVERKKGRGKLIQVEEDNYYSQVEEGGLLTSEKPVTQETIFRNSFSETLSSIFFALFNSIQFTDSRSRRARGTAGGHMRSLAAMTV